MLIINHQPTEVDADWNETSLLEFLRDKLGLVGTKFGCGIGECGACTVHLNGYAVRSCQVKVSSLKGQSITTIEGLGSKENPHVTQQAWRKLNVPQCGYCQAGQIMTAAALIDRADHPISREEAKIAMNGNLCRCGTYTRIADAVVDASRLSRSQT